VRDLQGVMLDELASDEELGRRVLRPAKVGMLALAEFPHLASDSRLLLDYLAGVDQTQAGGPTSCCMVRPAPARPSLPKRWLQRRA